MMDKYNIAFSKCAFSSKAITEKNLVLSVTRGHKEWKMQYRKFGKTGLEVSALGFGCMRLPLKAGGATKADVDEQEAIRIIRAGIDGGVTYLDSAWPYHGGQSEVIIGKALKDGYREKVRLATKCPTWLMNSPEDFDKYLDIQMKRLDVGHIDFYLLHNLYDTEWSDRVLKHGLLKKMEEARAAGKIGYIGFSFHDNYDVFMEILNGYDWDFCQIQMNYIDIDYQATIKGLEEVGRRGMGLVVMEPLLGGKLTRLPEVPAKLLSKEKTPAEWGLDFMWNRPEVSVVLSGMSDMQQVQENIASADRSSVGMLSKDDIAMLMKVRAAYQNLIIAPCTVCEYCLPCPAGIAIPQLLEALNRTVTLGEEEAQAYYDQNADVGAEACLHCKKCEGECPQHIAISDLMNRMAGIFVK